MTWKMIPCVAALVLLSGCAQTVAQEKAAPKAALKYGANPAAGKTFVHDGVRLYYEVYGEGEPLLMVHMNDGGIGSLSRQIDYFRTRYKVIAMDSRDQGKSGASAGKITYEAMTEDLSALLVQLKTGPVNVVGWSDGAVEALLLGMRHPEQVKKIAAMAANLTPEGLHPDTLAMIKGGLAGAPTEHERKLGQLMLDEPHIPMKALEAITAPTLVLASDHDLILDEHTMEIYHHLRNGELCIFPNATHMVPFDDPALFNSTVERFFEAPFVKKDRVRDMMKSFAKMGAQ